MSDEVLACKSCGEMSTPQNRVDFYSNIECLACYQERVAAEKPATSYWTSPPDGKSKKYDKSAFPSHGSMGEVVSEGMSYREYVAAKLYPALISVYCELDPVSTPSGIAKESVEFADALIAALNAKEG